MLKRITCCTIPIVLFSCTTYAEENIETLTQSSPSIVWYFIKVIFFLIIIVFLIRFLARFLSYSNKKISSSQPVKLLGGCSVGNNKSVQMVEAGGKIYILGVGNEVQLIDSVIDPEEHEKIINMVGNIQPLIPVSFSELVKSKELPFGALLKERIHNRLKQKGEEKNE